MLQTSATSIFGVDFFAESNATQRFFIYVSNALFVKFTPVFFFYQKQMAQKINFSLKITFKI